MVYKDSISSSEFAMWRAVFAFALVDNSLSLEEQDILQSHLKTVPFSTAQRDMLKSYFEDPDSDVEDLYKQITNEEDKMRFCVLARALAWCEGDMDRQEEKILKHVGCIKGVDDEILRESRTHPNLKNFYKHYAKAGMVGLMKYSPGVQMYV